MGTFPHNIGYKYGSESDTFQSFNRIYLPKGTKINCLPSANIYISLRGNTVDGPVYYNYTHFDWDGFTLPKDFYGNIVCSFGTWNHWKDKFDMTNLTQEQRMQFITIQSPEELENNPWRNKHWYAYGTSITDIGAKDTTGNSGHSGKYPLYLDMHAGMIRHNGAIGSGGILDKTDAKNVKKNILATPADADLVTLELLPNDDYTTKLGTIHDTDNSSFLGNLNQCLDYLVNTTHARIVFIFVTTSSSNMNANDHAMYDSLGTVRANYRNAVNKVKELAELYGCYCIDCDKEIWPYEQRNWGNLMADWIHPSYVGGWILGEYIWTKLKEIKPVPKWPNIDNQTKQVMNWDPNTSVIAE